MDLAKKVSKNIGRVCERQKSDYLKSDTSLFTLSSFRSFFSFTALIASGLKLHLQLNLTKLEQSHKLYLEWYAKSFQQAS